MVFVVLGKILQAVEPGAVRNSIAGPAESALTPGVLLPSALARLSSRLISASVLIDSVLVPGVDLVLEITPAPG